MADEMIVTGVTVEFGLQEDILRAIEFAIEFAGQQDLLDELPPEKANTVQFGFNGVTIRVDRHSGAKEIYDLWQDALGTRTRSVGVKPR